MTLGDMSRAEPALAILAFALIAALVRRKVPGAVILGILVVTALGLPLGLTSFQGIVAPPPDPRPTFLALDVGATVVGSVLGTSTVTSYIESAAGTNVGGRT